jgi:UDP-N-acetylmuramyl pentapeptide phosphotransferase/UDP-N-acetylglucosamine-1-phosphate transferase
MTMVVLLTGAAVFVATLIGVELMRRWGLRRLLDVPNARSSHTRPTPRGGGLALVVVAVGTWAALLTAYGETLETSHYMLLASTAAILVVSWLDDLHTLKFKHRLLIQVVAAASLLWVAPPPHFVVIGDLGRLTLGPLAWPLAIIWIVGLTNAYNFMDGIDGIAGGQGVVAGLAWATFILIPSDGVIGLLGLYLAIASAAFLVFNWSPAKIFMGDVGSATLGFLFAALPFLELLWDHVEIRSYWVPAAAMVWPFVFDAGFTLVRRWRRGERITEAHRSHLYQRLVIAGWSHAEVSRLFVAWALTTATAGIAMGLRLPGSGVVGLGWAVTSGVLVWRLVVRAERRSEIAGR